MGEFAMGRMACVDLPAFPLQLLIRRNPDWESCPAAVVDRDKAQGVILWANERARRLRILPGMRYAAALSLSRDLRAGVISRTDIEMAVDSLVPRLRFFTSGVEPSRSEPGVFWLEASGLSLLYPSLQKWADLIRADLFEAGFRSAVAVGFSRFGSYAAARVSNGSVVFETSSEERAYVREASIEQLSFSPGHRDLLARLGIHTLGRFLDLPASDVLARFGQETYRLYQSARGDLWAPLHPELPREPIKGNACLDHPEKDLSRLMLLIVDLLRFLVLSLTGRHEAISAVILRLVLDDRTEKTDVLRPASPTLDAAQILRLLQLRMEATLFSSGVVEIEMELQGVPPDPQQCTLFEEHTRRDHEAANQALAKLRAEFGEKAVVKAHLRDGHLPEARFRWEPMERLLPPKPRKVMHRPLVRRFFSRPVRLPPSQEALILSKEGGVAERIGPYVISGGWWVGEVHREYHFVRTRKGRWLWVYYDRRREGWFLHGEVE
jgi:protein ImuB